MAVIRVVFVVLVALAPSVAADNSYGAVAGVNVIDFSDAGIENTRLQVRPTIGGFYRVHRRVTMVDIGVQYSWRSVDWTTCGFSVCEGVPGASDGSWTFHDLEIPIIGRALVASTASLRVNLFGGVSPSLSLRKRESINGGVGESLMYITGRDLALLVGFGFELRHGELWLGLDVRGSIGLTHRYDPGDGDKTGNAAGGYLLLTVSSEPLHPVVPGR